jgi:hypothetical protein
LTQGKINLAPASAFKYRWQERPKNYGKTMFTQKISLALSLLLLVGCAQFTTGWEGNSGAYDEPYAQSDFDELLGFGANMAKTPPASRAETCRILLKRQQETPRAGFQLHLMVGRLLSDTCGDIPNILDGVSSIPAENLSDERLQKLISLHTEALKRMGSVPKKSCSQGRKQKSVQTVPETKESAGAKKDENRLLREKLEAIRSMEKHLDENSGGN